VSKEIKAGLVSVIVASYNHAEYLEQRMESLINQTYPDIEILVIDDCSTDHSIDVLKKYEFHPKVKLVIREKNGGWVTVSNQGVDLSVGEYIIFANCDDACDKHMIERLVIGIRSSPNIAISYCRSLMIDKSGKSLGDDFALRESAFKLRCRADTILSAREMCRFLLHSCVIPNLSAALFRRDCYISAGGLSPDYRVCSDWDLFFRNVAHHDVYYVAEPLNKFRQHQTTIRSSTKERILYGEIIGLLLGRIALLDLTPMERTRFRLRVMYIWSSHILRPSLNGFESLGYLSRLVFQLDPFAMIHMPLAIILRMGDLSIHLIKRIVFLFGVKSNVF